MKAISTFVSIFPMMVCAYFIFDLIRFYRKSKRFSEQSRIVDGLINQLTQTIVMIREVEMEDDDDKVAMLLSRYRELNEAAKHELEIQKKMI